MNTYFNYFRNPVPSSNERPEFIYFLGLFALYLFFILPVGAVLFMITKVLHISDVINTVKINSQFVLFLMILAPFYEEVLFRSWLKLKKIIVILLIMTLPLLAAKAIYDGKSASAVVVIFLLIGFLVLLLSVGREKIEAYVASHFRYFFYASILIFGLLHATNFRGNPYLILMLSPILAAPQLLLGCILGVIRMKHGLVYSILFHAAINSLTFLGFLIKPGIFLWLF